MKYNLWFFLLATCSMFAGMSTLYAQNNDEMIRMNAQLSDIISNRSFFDGVRPGVSAQQEWLSAGCKANFKLVSAKQEAKVVIEYHFMLSDLGAVTVEPTGTGGFQIIIHSVDGGKSIPQLNEIFENGVVVKRIPTYVDRIFFKLRDRDDAYNVSDMLRTVIVSCQ